MKKTCKNCYAADTGMHPLYGDPHGCTLGYKTDGEGHPQEECPKPKSWDALGRCEEALNRSKNHLKNRWKKRVKTS